MNYGKLLQQRAEVMRRIGTIKQTIAGLAILFGDEVLSDELLELVDRKNCGRQPGFTKACRMTLMGATVNDSHHAELRPITLGRDYGTEVEVVAGLNGDESVIANPPDFIVSGEEVRIAQPPTGTPASEGTKQ